MRDGKLVTIKMKSLVPIDHGLCIPDNLAVCTFDLAWLSWRQASLPFSRTSLAYIESINIMSDIAKLEKTFKFRPICLRNIRISTTLLQRGAKAGLNLEQICQILCRPDEDDSQPSLLDRIVDKARLISDMMSKLQIKNKGSNLRSIDKDTIDQRINGALPKRKHTHSTVGEEEFKLGGFQRQRVNSSNEHLKITQREFREPSKISP